MDQPVTLGTLAFVSPAEYPAYEQVAADYAAQGYQAVGEDVLVKFQAESNFFTRVRTGTMPIGIGNYGTYLQLLTSAPELYGRWSIAPVPGTEQADGTVSHAVGTTASTAGVILSQSDKREAAWEFLKW